MLIICGADLTGKTTLVKRLAARLQEEGMMHMPMHLTRPPTTFDSYHGYIDKISRDVIFDRFHLDELAYRKHDDRPSAMTPLKYSLVDAAVRFVGGYTVVLTALPSVITTRWRKGEMYSLQHVLDVNATYKEIVAHGEIEVRDARYRPDIDHWIEVTDAETGISNQQVDHIVQSYLARQEEILTL